MSETRTGYPVDGIGPSTTLWRVLPPPSPSSGVLHHTGELWTGATSPLVPDQHAMLERILDLLNRIAGVLRC